MTWTCDDTRRQLLREDEWPEQAFEHLTSCAICQEMYGSLAAAEPPQGMPPLPESLVSDTLWARTERDIAAERGVLAWLRSRPTRQRYLLGLSVALAPALIQVAWARRSDFEIYPLPRLLLFGGVYAAALVVVERELLTPLFRPQRARPRWLATALSMSLPFAVAAAAPAYVEAATLSNAQTSFLEQVWLCLRYGTLLSLPALLTLFALDRQLGRSRGFRVPAAAFGANVGNLALLLHCPIENPTHQLLGHAGIVVVFLLPLLAWVVLSRLRRLA